jgi:aspartate kinase
MISTIDKPWLVQKYGGTSLGKLLEKICSTIIPSHLQNNNLVVVCSAISGSTKASGTTSLLLECISQAEAPYASQAQLNQTLDVIRDAHLRIIDEHLFPFQDTNRKLYEDVKTHIQKECENLRKFLLAAQVRAQLLGSEELLLLKKECHRSSERFHHEQRTE